MPAMKRLVIASLLASSLATPPAAALTIDPFLVFRDVARRPVKTALPREGALADEDYDPCDFGPLPKVLDLLEVVERSLCQDPQVRQAWAQAKYQAAVLGVRQGAYLPTLSATLNAGQQSNHARYAGKFSVLNSDSKPSIYSGGLKMTWVLTDFNMTRSNVRQARAMLEAANSAHDTAIQAAFLRATQAYFDALAAQAVLNATREVEKLARESLLVAEGRVKGGVSSLTDQLQASTAHAQAKLERVAAESDYQSALGNIAIAIGVRVGGALDLEKADALLHDTSFVKSADELIDEARSAHPRLLSLRSEVDAAEAGVSAMRAEGRPSVVLSAEAVRTSQENQLPSAGYQPTDINNRNSAIGVQINIPLFEGFSRSYKVQSAKSQVEAKEAEYAATEKQVMLEVWKGYQVLGAETQNLDTTQDLLGNARKSFEVARGRYKEGVGSIVELLNVQATLAKALQQRVKTLSNWHNARLKLAASVGKIDYWAISGLFEKGGRKRR